MCTVTWLFEPDGYQLFCNRDELRTRSRAAPPRTWSAEGVRFLAPTDSEAGGTWIAVNEAGVSLCLLNDYSAAAVDARAGSVSRGLLVASLAGLGDSATIVERLGDADLTPYRPFHLLMLEPRSAARIFHWNGRRSGVQPAGEPALLTSSSVDAAGAKRERRSLLERRGRVAGFSAADLVAYHRSHEPERSALSPCMHRADASTVSFSHIGVDEETVSFAYADGPPCTARARECGSIDRRDRISI